MLEASSEHHPRSSQEELNNPEPYAERRRDRESEKKGADVRNPRGWELPGKGPSQLDAVQ